MNKPLFLNGKCAARTFLIICRYIFDHVDEDFCVPISKNYFTYNGIRVHYHTLNKVLKECEAVGLLKIVVPESYKFVFKHRRPSSIHKHPTQLTEIKIERLVDEYKFYQHIDSQAHRDPRTRKKQLLAHIGR